MKKLTSLKVLALLVLLAAPWASRATTDSLLVADGTSSNTYIPVYGFWADAAQHNQIIYPASMLTEMIGQNIVGMSFFVTGSWSCSAVVRMAIVDDSVLTGLRSGDTLVEVWAGPWTSSTELAFGNPFAYNGGNLLVDIQTTAGSYNSSTSTGIYRAGASYYSYNSSSSVQDFLPKTIFLYNDDAFCAMPVAVTFDDASTSSLSFHWTAGGEETMWDVMVGDSVIEGISSTSVTVNDLIAGIRYPVRVRSICDAESSSNWTSPVVMTTECATVTSLPWINSFEGEEDSIPLCWTRSLAIVSTQYNGTNVSAPFVPNDSYYAHTGSGYLYYYLYGGYGLPSAQSVIATPYFAHNPAALHVTFWLYPSDFYSGSLFEAGIMTDPYDTATFIPVYSLTADDFESYNYSQFEFYTSSLADLFTDSDSGCVAFRVTGSMSSSMYLYMDDVMVEAMGDCLPPVLNSGIIDSLSYESVQLSWMVADDATDFVVRLVEHNGYPYTETYYSATDTAIFIENLPGNTVYDAYVATLCGDDTTSYVSLGSFTTDERCYTVQNVNVAALTANAAALVWNFENRGINPTDVILVLTDNTDNTTAPLTMNVGDVTNYTFTGLEEGHLYTVSVYTVCGDDGDTSAVVTVNFMPHTPPCAEVAGSSTNNYVPFYSFYNNGFTESLYEGSLLEGVDSVTGISFEVASSLSRNNIIDIYMGYTTRTSIGSSNSAYVPVSQLTQVVSDYSLNTGSTGWTDMIPFDAAFHTQPTGDSLNLIIAVYNHTGSYSSGLVWATHLSPIGSSAYCYTDNSISVSNPWTGNTGTTDMAPNIQFYGSCGGGACLPPSVAVSATDQTTATLTWLPGASESSWIVEYRVMGATTWINGGTAIAQPFTVTGLEPGTTYQFRLGADCTDTVVYSNTTAGTTACGSMHAPFSITPDGENTCWTYGGDGYYSSYSNYYYFYNAGYIVTPELADSISSLQVKVRGYGYEFYIGACDANGANPVWIDTVSFPNGDYSVSEIRKSYLNSYTGDKRYIILRAANGYNYTYLYNIAIEPLDDCMPVSNVSVDSVTTSDAWLSWESEGDNFEVQYRPESTPTAAWTTVTAYSNDIHLTGLNSSDRYQVKIYNVCSSTSRSDSITLRLATGCVNMSAPYNEQFGQPELPVCWNTINYGTSEYDWAYNAGYSYNYISSEAPYSGTANDWVMTPMIQMPADASNYMLIYAVGGGPSTYYAGSVASYEVYVSTTGNSDTSSYTLVYSNNTIDTYNSSVYAYMLDYHRISLAAYSGQAISIAFRNISANYGEIYIGDVSVRQAVEPIYNISGSSTVFLGDTAQFIASYQEGDLTTMSLQWSSSMAADGLAVMSGDTTENMTLIYTADGVDTITFIASNSYGADTSRMLVYVYDCSSPVTVFPFHEGFETMEAPAGCWSLEYGDPSVNPMIHLEVGNDSYLSSTHEGDRVFRFSSFSSSSTQNYNQYLISRELAGTNMVVSFWYLKGSYSSSTEDNIRVGYSSTTRDTAAFTWGQWIENISIDNWAQFTDTLPEGTKYVAIQYWGDFAYYIYIDDFTISGISAICNAPIIASAAVGENNVTVNWEGSTNSYEVAIVQGSWVEPATTTVVTDTFYTFSGLTEQTLYTIGVRAVCGNGYYSDWALQGVTTLRHPCYVPTNVEVGSESYDGGVISWTAGENETAWEVSIVSTAAGYEQVFTVNNTPTLTVNSLDAGVTYSVMVRSECDSNYYSDWTEPVALTTLECDQVSEVDAIEITANSAKISWTDMGATKYVVEYGNAGYSAGAGTQTIVENATQVVINGLDEQSFYDVYVSQFCTETLQSPWSPKLSFQTEAGVGIDQVENGNVALYPNPASTTVTVSGIEGEAMVTVVDMNGREVYTATANGSVTIDVNGYAKGAYFVRVTGERTTAIRKLIVK